jgi:HlyD family secretion protein
MRKIIVAVLVVILLGGVGAGAYWYTHRTVESAGRFRTAPATRGDIVSTVFATGTIEPIETVDVGAQVAGTILSFGTDVNGKPVDYNSVVDTDTVLAEIDPRLYKAALDSAEATLLQAQAAVPRAYADLAQKQALLVQATNDWNRAQELWNTKSGALAQTAYDQYKANYESAKANVDMDVANIKAAEAAVVQDQGNVDQCKTNLAYCTIKSPVKGTIIDRRVNIGQTVVSSLSTPSLFLIAKDLTQLQIWAAVNEADVGGIYPGQPVKFQVDAFPNQTFDGTVNRVRLNATMTSNVVTYTVEVNTDNKSGKLLPYLTANAWFETGRRDKILMVPNSALRWTPTPAQRESYARRASGGKGRQTDSSGGEAQAQTTGEGAEGGQPQAQTSGSRRTRGTIWVPDGAYVKPVRVRIGITDGVNTEVSGQGVDEGLEVVTGDIVPGGNVEAASSSSTGASPFTPQLPPRKRGR